MVTFQMLLMASTDLVGMDADVYNRYKHPLNAFFYSVNVTRVCS